jgi:hypothetical protein
MTVVDQVGAVSDSSVYVCEWHRPDEKDYVVRLRTQASQDLLTASATINGREELPSLGDGGFEGLGLDGRWQTVLAGRHGNSMSVECNHKAATWKADGCRKLAELVVGRMP